MQNRGNTVIADVWVHNDHRPIALRLLVTKFYCFFEKARAIVTELCVVAETEKYVALVEA